MMVTTQASESQPPLRGRAALVVGGAGFVGSNLVRRLLREDVSRVTVVDNFLSSEPENLPSDPIVELRVGSIADDELLATLNEADDLVFHLATYHGNQSSIADPLADHENNLLATLKLFERLKDFRRAPRVVYASTGCALAAKGDGASTPVVEDGPIPLDFDSPYQISKVVGEMYALYYGRAHRLPVVRARFQNVYGPGEILGAGRWRGTPATIWRNVVPAFVYRALKGLPLELHAGGSPTRDFIYVDDVVEGLIRCARTAGIEGDVFNLASGKETSIRSLAEAVIGLTGNPAGVVMLPARDWDRSVSRVGSTSKARRDLGFEATTELQDGLAATAAWTRQHLELIDRCVGKHAAHHAIEV